MDWNGFRGKAVRIDDYDLPRIGHKIGVGEDEIHAVMDVESRGYGFDKLGRPIILFERHWFYRFLKKKSAAKLQKAVNAGLAVSKWSRATYNQDQYKLLERAIEIDETAAIKSASWGLGQVMGFNHSLAGYDTPQEMVLAFMHDEAEHLEGMINFIINSGLDDEIRRHDWAGFARGYNGSGYKANSYDTRLARAYKKWQGIKDTPWSPDMAVEEEESSHQTELPLPEPKQAPEETDKLVRPSDDIPSVDVPEKVETPVRPSVSAGGLLSELFKSILGRD